MKKYTLILFLFIQVPVEPLDIDTPGVVYGERADEFSIYPTGQPGK